MKQAKILCTILLDMEDDMTEDEAIDSILLMIDPDLSINIQDVEVKETD